MHCINADLSGLSHLLHKLIPLGTVERGYWYGVRSAIKTQTDTQYELVQSKT